jgi:antitoxin YefM
MLVISTREFRDNQKNYLEKVDAGLELLIRRGKNKSYKVTPVAEDDSLMSKEEFFAKIDRALEQYKRGEYTVVRSKDELKNFLDSL